MKTILVIDLPANIDLKDLYANVQVNSLLNTKTDYYEEFMGVKLKPMPEKMVVENRWFSEEYAMGYNACIEEILGDTNR